MLNGPQLRGFESCQPQQYQWYMWRLVVNCSGRFRMPKSFDQMHVSLGKSLEVMGVFEEKHWTHPIFLGKHHFFSLFLGGSQMFLEFPQEVLHPALLAGHI